MNYTRIAGGILAAVVLTGAVTAMAAPQGGQDDPLVTLSYLTGVLTPKLEGEVTKAVTANEKALTDKLNAAIADYEARMKDLMAQGGDGGAVFESVTLTKETQTVGKGEYLLRSGSAVCVGELIDSTAGTLLAAGDALSLNHLYLALDKTGGVNGASGATLLIKGY